MGGVCEVLFLFVCQAPESFILSLTALFTPSIIKRAISSADFHPEFAFLRYIPAACQRPCAAPPESLSGSWRSERERLKEKGDDCVTNHIFNEPFLFLVHA